MLEDTVCESLGLKGSINDVSHEQALAATKEDYCVSGAGEIVVYSGGAQQYTSNVLVLTTLLKPCCLLFMPLGAVTRRLDYSMAEF